MVKKMTKHLCHVAKLTINKFNGNGKAYIVRFNSGHFVVIKYTQKYSYDVLNVTGVS
jgi:hypothetical protein